MAAVYGLLQPHRCYAAFRSYDDSYLVNYRTVWNMTSTPAMQSTTTAGAWVYRRSQIYLHRNLTEILGDRQPAARQWQHQDMRTGKQSVWTVTGMENWWVFYPPLPLLLKILTCTCDAV